MVDVIIAVVNLTIAGIHNIYTLPAQQLTYQYCLEQIL